LAGALDSAGIFSISIGDVARADFNPGYTSQLLTQLCHSGHGRQRLQVTR